MSAAEQLKGLPDHYLPIMPYLVVKDADGFIEFIKTVFAAEEKLRVNMDDGSIMHAEYSVNGGTIMFGQAGGQWPPFPCGMYLVVKDVDGLYAKGLGNGATATRNPPNSVTAAPRASSINGAISGGQTTLTQAKNPQAGHFHRTIFGKYSGSFTGISSLSPADSFRYMLC